MGPWGERLLARIEQKTALVGVVGLGYVGLPLARAFAAAGFGVLGFDTDPDRVDRLNRGESPLGHLPDAAVRELRAAGFTATADPGRLNEPDAVLVCVPTPLTEAQEPDLSCVRGAAEAIAARLRPGQLVVLESTTYPGTSREVILPALARSGLAIGTEAFLAYSPEREDPGVPAHAVARVPKVVGGLGPDDLALACAMYRGVAGGVVPVSGLEAAEACKLLENTYRAVNVALVNELKLAFGRMGVDVWEVVAAAATKPFGFQRFDPGPGLGGPCVPVNPHYLAWAARRCGAEVRLVEAAGAVNAAMPGHVADRVAAALAARGRAVGGARVLLLGMAYKRDVGDPRESPGFEILDRLVRLGAEVAYNDPHLPALPPVRRWPHRPLVSQPLTEALVRAQDAVVVVTDHSAYDWERVVSWSSLVVDTRNATRGLPGPLRDRVVRA